MVDVVLVDEDGTDVVAEVLVVGVTDTVLVVVGVTVDVVVSSVIVLQQVLANCISACCSSFNSL